MISKEWGEIIQLSGVLLLLIGISIEIVLLAPIGFIIISVGSLVFALGTKYKHQRSDINERTRDT